VKRWEEGTRGEGRGGKRGKCKKRRNRKKRIIRNMLSYSKSASRLQIN
jgi:hypothetical protein